MTFGRLSHVGAVSLPIVALPVTMIALITGHPAVAELVGGVLVIVVALQAGTRLARMAAWEPDPDRELGLDVLLVLVVLLGLAGMTLIGLTIPRPG
jgi:hypothetical protein